MLRRFIIISPNSCRLPPLSFLLTTAPPDDDDLANLTRKLSAEHPIGAIILIAIATAALNVTNDAGTKKDAILRRRRCDGSFLDLEDMVPPDKYN